MTEQVKTFAQSQSDYTTNMTILHGWTTGTLKGMEHFLEYARRYPNDAQYGINVAMKDLQKLLRVMDLVWENRTNRVVDLTEYSNA